MFNKFCRLWTRKALEQLKLSEYLTSKYLSTNVAYKNEPKERSIKISCKRKEYNHFLGDKCNKLEDVVLASKGWNHSKAKGDYFVIHPIPDTSVEHSWVPLSEIELDRNLKTCLDSQNITKLTSFQTEAVAVIGASNHAVLAAETGCGKTLAYLLPILQNLIDCKKEDIMNAPRALILIPNRELAYQIGTVAQSIAESVKLKVKVVVGGRTKKQMLNPEFADIDVLIGTPGVIGKLSSVGVFRLTNVVHTVLDESDTLLDDSFIERLTGIMKRVSQSQLTLVSATLPNKLPSILEPYETSFKHIISPLLHKPLNNITQRFLRLIRSAKPSQILQIAKTSKDPLLIFTNRSMTCNWLGMFLNDNGIKSVRINGDMNYAVRIEQWNDFVTKKANVLIATDVGSRGLDTTNIKHVVNYDFPLYAADYIHRVGRTGRLGSPEGCKVTNFISGPEEIHLVQKIELAVRRNEAIPNVDGNITRIIQNKVLREMRNNNNTLS